MPQAATRNQAAPWVLSEHAVQATRPAAGGHSHLVRESPAPQPPGSSARAPWDNTVERPSGTALSVPYPKAFLKAELMPKGEAASSRQRA